MIWRMLNDTSPPTAAANGFIVYYWVERLAVIALATSAWHSLCCPRTLSVDEQGAYAKEPT
jgi:hypothetical protein